MHIFPKSTVVVTDIVKTAFGGDGTDLVIGMFEKVCTLIDPVIIQICKRCHMCYGFKQAAANIRKLSRTELLYTCVAKLAIYIHKTKQAALPDMS